MPRPDKEINPGRLDGPISPSRSQSWTKYSGAETVEGNRGASNAVEITVDDITVTEVPDERDSKYETRGTSAHGIGLPEDKLKASRIEYVKEWVVDRTVEDRIYRRSDKLIMVELSD
jgi:hypothetical protein